MSVDPGTPGAPIGNTPSVVSAVDWRVVAASTRGTSHIKTGLPCQDSHTWRSVPPGVLIAAVADGAGSASSSELGSVVAAQAAVDEIADDPTLRDWLDSSYDWEPRLRHALSSARAAVERAAAEIGQPSRELATTLIVLVVSASRVLVAQVGDGAVVASDHDGGIFPVTNPPTDEYVNRTVFLTGAGAPEHAQLAIWRGTVEHVAAFSDGLQRLALQMSDSMPHKPFFTPLFQFIDQALDVMFADLRSFALFISKIHFKFGKALLSGVIVFVFHA